MEVMYAVWKTQGMLLHQIHAIPLIYIGFYFYSLWGITNCYR